MPAFETVKITDEEFDQLVEVAKGQGQKYSARKDSWGRGQFAEPWHTFVGGLVGELAFSNFMRHYRADFPKPDYTILPSGEVSEHDFTYKGKTIQVKCGRVLVRTTAKKSDLFVFTDADIPTFLTGRNRRVTLQGWCTWDKVKSFPVCKGKGDWNNYQGTPSDIEISFRRLTGAKL